MRQKDISAQHSVASLTSVALLLGLTGGALLLSAPVAYAQLTERLQTHFDVFPGKNSPGPYNLSWMGIENARDTTIDVIVDGQSLRREQFRVDAAKGQISFSTPLAEKSVARVTYRYNPNSAKPNPAVTSQPLYLPVTGFGHNSLKVIALPNSESQKTGSVPLVFSVGNKSQFLGGGLTSELKFANSERNAVQVGFRRGNEKNLVDATYARNAKEFATTMGKAIGATDAMQRKGLETRLTPAKYLATNYKLSDDRNLLTNERKAVEGYNVKLGEGGTKPTLGFARSDSLTVTPDRKENRLLSDRLDLGTNFSKVTAVQFNRAEDTTTTPDKKETKVTKDHYGFGTKFNTVTAFGVNRNEDTTLAPGDLETKVTRDRYDLATKVNKVTSLGVNRAQDTTVTPDKKETQVFKDILDLKTSLDKVTSLGLNRTEDKVIAPDKYETRVKTDKLDLTKRLDKMTSVTATTQQAVTEGSKPITDAVAKGAAVTVTSAANGGAKQLSATVNSTSREGKTSVELNRSMTVRLQPAPIFVLSASQAEQKVTPVSANGSTGTANTVLTQTATAEIVPVTGAKMTSSLVETTNNNVKVSTTNFGAEVGTGKSVEVKANVINRSSEAVGARTLDTTQTQVALRPLRSVTLTGSYVWNPVDPANGAIQQSMRQEFAFNAKMGALEFGSGYSLTTLTGRAKNDEDDPQFGTVSLTLGMRFSRFTQLTGAFKDSLRYGAINEVVPAQLPKYLRTFNLGLTHDIGSAFNLSLGGSVIDDRSRAKAPTDLKAEAKVGVRF